MNKDIVMVIVVYEMKMTNSPTILCLINAFQYCDFSNVCIIIYDNSCKSQNNISNIPFDYIYFHNQSNGGLCAAYNYTLKYALENKISWLLLLDQDTSVTTEYFKKAFCSAKELLHNNEVVCILPRTISNSSDLISPTKVSIWGWNKWAGDLVGTCSIQITGINSGTLLRTSFMSSIGGFNADYKLDMLDHWYFFKVFTARKKFYILDVSIFHSLSILNYENISLARHSSILDSEILFMINNKSKKYIMVYQIRLILRFLRQIFMVENKEIALLTLKKCFLITKYILCK